VCEINQSAMEDIEDIINSKTVYEDIVDVLKKGGFKDWMQLQRKLFRISKKHRLKAVISKNIIRNIIECHDDIEIPEMLRNNLLKVKTRSLSGVLVVTLFTSAHPTYVDQKTKERVTQKFSCKHDCYYCPLEPAHQGNGWVEQPRSYLTNEPGVLRANRNGFDCVKQFRSRIGTLRANGHPIDKLEVIVLGGTWSEYPLEYQKEFIRDIYYSANTIHVEDISRLRDPLSLQDEIMLNSIANNKNGCPIIGLTLETRPDTITLDEMKQLREYGCTRVQLGVQNTDNEILKKINRGHTVEDSKKAIKKLKQNGFKVDIHIMPMLPGSTPDSDIAMFRHIIESEDLQADQWKIYPTSVVPWSKLEKMYQLGKYKPYSFSELIEVLIEVKSMVPPWIRLNRVIRDINSEYILGGCNKPNGRQMIHDIMKDRGISCYCIRCREVKDRPIVNPVLLYEMYRSSCGMEVFLSYESGDLDPVFGDRLRDLYAFLRLRINDVDLNENEEFVSELFRDGKCAMIRELHVYGNLKKIGKNNDNDDDNNKEFAQHRGFGKSLIHIAEDIAQRYGCDKIAIIAGVGVRPYYEKLGYQLVDTYMVKKLPQKRKIYYLFSFLIGLCFFYLYFYFYF
jgi:ELP3 family radical SAM enzyme/protein acetyltransferase